MYCVRPPPADQDDDEFADAEEMPKTRDASETPSPPTYILSNRLLSCVIAGWIEAAPDSYHVTSSNCGHVYSKYIHTER